MGKNKVCIQDNSLGVFSRAVQQECPRAEYNHVGSLAGKPIQAGQALSSLFLATASRKKIIGMIRTDPCFYLNRHAACEAAAMTQNRFQRIHRGKHSQEQRPSACKQMLASVKP